MKIKNEPIPLRGAKTRYFLMEDLGGGNWEIYKIENRKCWTKTFFPWPKKNWSQMDWKWWSRIFKTRNERYWGFKEVNKEEADKFIAEKLSPMNNFFKTLISTNNVDNNLKS